MPLPLLEPLTQDEIAQALVQFVLRRNNLADGTRVLARVSYNLPKNAPPLVAAVCLDEPVAEPAKQEPAADARKGGAAPAAHQP